MLSSSMESPSKKYKPSDPQKNVFPQSFRSKTEKAIQLINKHESQKYNFLKTLNSSKKFLNLSPNKTNQEYFSIIQIPQISIQQSVKVQLLPFTDQIYKMRNPFCNLNENNNVNRSSAIEQEDESSSQGTIPIQNSQIKLNTSSYNKSQSSFKLNRSVLEKNNNPVHQMNCKLKIFIKNFRGAAAECLVYFQDSASVKDFNFHFHKYMISSEKIFNINMEDFWSKKWIYLRFKSRSQLSMFIMRVQKESFAKQRISTEEPQVNEFSSRNENAKQLPQLKASRSLKIFKSNQSEKVKPYNLKKSGSLILKHISQGQENSSNELSPSSKKKNKEILEKLKKQELLKKKQEQNKKQEQILQKKTAIEIVKQKELKLRSKALEMKKLVEQYKKIHEDQQHYRKFLLPKLIALMILPRFNKVCRQMIVDRQNGMQMARKTRALTKKFSKIIKNKYKQSIQHVKNRKVRQLVGVVNFTTLFAKILHKNSVQKCQNVIISTINITIPGHIINHCFDHATSYRRSIRHIQKTWLAQFNAKMTMFQMYVKDQAQALIVKYPYFKFVQAKFITQNVPKTLAYKYLADESSKLRYLFEDHKQKLDEINDFNEMNKKIIEFNKTALKKRQKPLLEVPKTPCRPSTRYFRNISFLKSMIRGWFEVEYRKWARVNKMNLSVNEGLNKNKDQSPKKSLKLDASINSIDLSSPRKKQ